MEKDARAALGNPGIKHVFYIIKENRTYDQILGDMATGNGDKSICLFPRDVTPNQHALAERFAQLDNFYCCAEVSADGWDWSVSGMASEYTARNTPFNYSGRGREYDFEGQTNGVPVDLYNLPDVARAPGGYFWDACAAKGVSFRNYGFYLNFALTFASGVPDENRKYAANVRENFPTKRALVGHSDTDFRQFDMNYPDSELGKLLNLSIQNEKTAYGSHKSSSRYAEWKREFDEYVKNGKLPQFEMIRLPRDHTSGTRAGSLSPEAMVADNDYGVGQVVEAISHSPYWKQSAIFILEDDAQGGFDHVDAHRSVGFVISPWVKRGTLDSRFYNTDSMLRTMGLLLGLPPLCQYDAVAAAAGGVRKRAGQRRALHRAPAESRPRDKNQYGVHVPGKRLGATAEPAQRGIRARRGTQRYSVAGHSRRRPKTRHSAWPDYSLARSKARCGR